MGLRIRIPPDSLGRWDDEAPHGSEAMRGLSGSLLLVVLLRPSALEVDQTSIDFLSRFGMGDRKF